MARWLWILLLLTTACGSEPVRQLPDTVASPATATLSETGLGSVVVGMTPAEASAAAGGRFQPSERPAATGCDYASDPTTQGLTFMIEQGRVVRVDVRTPAIRTAEGGGVGDSEARIQELYAGRITVTPHKYTDGHYLTVTPRDSARGPAQLIFETDGHVVTRMRGGLLPQVAYVEGCG